MASSRAGVKGQHSRENRQALYLPGLPSSDIYLPTKESYILTPDAAVEYRKAPEHRFPAAVEDVFSTVVWLQDNTTTLNVDPARIILYGPSAGGGVAAGAVLMARDKGLNPPVAGQVLKYPMIDDRTTISENSPLFPHLLWTPARNDMGWKAYLGKERGEAHFSLLFIIGKL